MERHTKSYLQLIKPGITISNVISALAGYFLAVSANAFSVTTLVGAIGGVALVVASACVINNMIDRKRDTKMKRTRGREIAAGNIPLGSALLYAVVLGGVGFTLLITWTNYLTALLGLVAYVWYVAVYGFAKRHTPLSTLIGGVCGALPPVAGYTAVTGNIDATAIILFLLLMVWQLPHFYAISIFRKGDYKNADLPVWAVRYGTKSTKAQIFFWVIVFAILSPFLTIVGATGYVYLIVMMLLSIYWVFVGAKEYKRLDDEKWARKMFGVSLLVLLSMCTAIATGGYLP